ncbi:relaxase/mobilization nuclease domain-containing protein [Nocardia sp. NPDC004151]|uniref:relaxase/mobilization nuclease domain-containing protein n=1 Tax=Nocardia sp. NPDC004151 TaxID=3364304 RepID=UPI0036891943
MIAKISRGQKLGGLMVYLLGKSDHNEHKDRHIIAGSPTVMRAAWLEHFDGESPEVGAASREAALAVAHEIEIPRALYGTQARMKARPVAVGVGGREPGLDVVEPAGKGEKSVMRNAPVWHCVLALQPGEELDDAKWSQITHEFMARMGFAGTKDGKVAQARWAAVRHGHSGEHGDGQDHIHIAASLVREDGSKVSTFDYGPGRAKGDWKRADEVCGELEREFGLQILTTRSEGGGLSQNSRAEIERAKRLDASETERERLRRLVRAHAVASDSESEFVTGLRAAGISIRPRYAAGTTDEVTGYSVRWHRDGSEIGPWVGGGKLAKDLTLRALREQQWDDSPQARRDALSAWNARTGGASKTARGGRGDGVDAWQRAADDIAGWRERLAQIPHDDRRQWAYMAGQAAGVFAAWSEVFEGDQPGAFAAAAKEMTRSAQVERAAHRWRPARAARSNVFADTAKLLLDNPGVGVPRSHRREAAEDAAVLMAALLLALMLLLLLLAVAVVAEVARAHRSRGELGRAVEVDLMTHHHLDPVLSQWESELEDRRFQWDRDAAQVFTAAAGRAAQRGLAAAAVTVSPDTDQPTGLDRTTDVERRQVAAVAGEPVAASAAEPVAAHPRRRFYSDLPYTERAGLRAAAVASRAFGSDDLRPRGWTDALLDGELAHRRAEVDLLAADIEACRAGQGPHAVEVRAAIVAETRAAEKIPAAQQARDDADQLAVEQRKLVGKRTRLEQELAELPRRKVLARGKLQAELAETLTELDDIAPHVTGAARAAEAAAKATGVPENDWNSTLSHADPRHQKMRLNAALSTDRHNTDEDATYLYGLQRDLQAIETEHARRAKLTPAQQAREADSRTETSTRNPARWQVSPPTGPAPEMPYRSPDPRRGPDHGIGR